MLARKRQKNRLLTAFLFLTLTGVACTHETGRVRSKPLPIPPPGEAQALIAQKGDLPGGPKAEGKPGDFVLRNHLVTFVIASVRRTSGYSLYGGRVLDAVLNEPGHDLDMMGEVFFSAMDQKGLFNLRVLRATKAEIVSKGGQGKPAHLRVEAVDERFPIVDQTLRMPSTPFGLKVTLDYLLFPDSPTLLITCRMKNGSDKPQTYTLFLGQIQGDGLTSFIPPWGSADYAMQTAGGTPVMGLIQTVRGSIPLVANLGSRLGYGFFRLEGDIEQVQRAENIYQLTLSKPVALAPKEESEVKLALSVSEGEMEPFLQEIRRLRGIAHPVIPLEGNVQTRLGVPVPDARIYVMKQEGNGEWLQTVLRSDGRGSFRAELLPGTYRFIAFAEGYPPAEGKVQLGMEGAGSSNSSPSLTLQLELPARLKLQVRDEAGRPLPCAVVFERLGGVMPNSERVRYGEQGDFGRFQRVYFSLTGNETLKVEPGHYRIILTHGFEYELAQKELNLQSGHEVRFEATLAHTAWMEGYLSGDFHIHALPSPDSNDFLEDKVRAYLAAGVHIMTSTDHDVNTDYRPVIRALRLEDQLTAIVGTEITPSYGLGHFNAYPQRYDPSLPNNGAVSWYDRSAREIFQAARQNYPGDVIIQVNHPRTPTGGYLLYLGFDPTTGTFKRPEEFAPDFDALEVYNGPDSKQLETTFPDWFAFLNQGKRYLAIGNTDSHHAYRLEPGFPRTYLYFGHRVVRRVRESTLTQAIRSGNVVVCGGPMIEVKANGNYSLGSTVPLKEGHVSLQVRVKAASWVRVNRLKVILNGTLVREIPILHPPDKPLDWQQTIPLTIEKDSWAIFIVEGDRFEALYPGRKPVSFTNPIYFKYEPNSSLSK